MNAQQAYEKLLIEKKLRNTQSRRKIIDYIFSEDKHFTAEDLMRGLSDSKQAVSKATIYRTLAMMVEGGLVVEHDFNTGEKMYEIATDKPHHDHLYCDRCHTIIEFYEPQEEQLIETVAKLHNFEVQSHVMKIFGLCSDCRKT